MIIKSCVTSLTVSGIALTLNLYFDPGFKYFILFLAFEAKVYIIQTAHSPYQTRKMEAKNEKKGLRSMRLNGQKKE